MKQSLIALAVFGTIGLVGCGSTSKPTALDQPVEYKTPVKDAKITTEFMDNGIKLHYTLLGKLESIEVTGVAEAWKKQHDVISEIDAKNKLVKFIYGETVSTDRNMRVIAKSIENAKDDVTNDFRSSQGTLKSTDGAKDDKDLMSTLEGDESTQKANTALRRASIINTTIINTVDNIKSSGRLTGVIKTREFTKDDGKTYVAVYEWTQKNQAVADSLRSIMSAK
jgi:hypothetical protein